MRILAGVQVTSTSFEFFCVNSKNTLQHGCAGFEYHCYFGLIRL